MLADLKTHQTKRPLKEFMGERMLWLGWSHMQTQVGTRPRSQHMPQHTAVSCFTPGKAAYDLKSEALLSCLALYTKTHFYLSFRTRNPPLLNFTK